MKNLLNLFFLLVAMMIGTTLCSCSKDDDDETTETTGIAEVDYETQHKDVYEGKQYDLHSVYTEQNNIDFKTSLPQHISSQENNFFISFDNVYNIKYDGVSLSIIQIDTNKETNKTINPDYSEWRFINPKQFEIEDKDREFYLEVCSITYEKFTNKFHVGYCIIPKNITHTPNSFKVDAYYKLKE